MHFSTLARAFAALSFLAVVPAAQAPLSQRPAIQLWYYHHTYLSNDDALRSSKALVDRAAAAGYTGLVLADSNINTLGDDFMPIENQQRLGELVRYATGKHMRVIFSAALFGYSNDVLEFNPNEAEGQRIVGAEFQVNQNKKRLDFKNSFPGLANSGFEQGKTDWFDTGDAGLGVNTVAHSGQNAAVIVDAPGNARLRQKFPLRPWRQYHLRLFYKSSDFRGMPMVEVMDAANFDKVRLSAYINAPGSRDWTQLDFTFNSQGSTEGYLYLGVWGGSRGILWFDDVQIEETALVFLIRREGAPLKLYDPNHPETVYKEGEDFKTVWDPQLEGTRTPFKNNYHDPAPVMLPSGTHLKPGQTVAIDFYAGFPVPNENSISMCMTSPTVMKWMEQNARAIKGLLPATGGVLLGYDEIRNMNSCASCRAKNMSAGDLLAWSFGQTAKIYGSAIPEAMLYTWNDMFDPYQNARDHYYYVEGDLTGSWKGVPSNVIVFNWNLEKLRDSLTWFSGKNGRQPVAHQQIIAGYYDSGNGAAAAQQELAGATGVPGVLGLMYTTWNDDYKQLESFAQTAKAKWGDYLASVGR